MRDITRLLLKSTSRIQPFLGACLKQYTYVIPLKNCCETDLLFQCDMKVGMILQISETKTYVLFFKILLINIPKHILKYSSVEGFHQGTQI